jgi:hypothetical protein
LIPGVGGRRLPPMRIVLLLAAMLCVPAGAIAPAPIAQIDHVIIGVADLDRGIAEVERLTGVRPAQGGVHPGRGTRNALMSLGEDVYLELIAPNPAERVDTPYVRRLRALKRPTPDGWAVAPLMLDLVHRGYDSAALALTPPEPGSRALPGGGRLHWTTFGFAAFDHPSAPFFIQWGDMTRHPSRTAPSGCVLASLTLHEPAPNALAQAVAPLGLGVPVVQAGKSAMEITLRCPKGTVIFR